MAQIHSFLTDFEGNIYFRQEGKGMLLGTYEQKSTPWKVDGTPMNFGHELLEPKLDNIQDRLAIGFERMPALEKAGIKNYSKCDKLGLVKLLMSV